jgi:hypothetical protein
MAKTKWLNEQETLARFPHRIGVKTLENFPTDLLRRTHRWKKDRCPRCGQVTLEKQRFYLAQHVRWLARAAEHEPHSVKVAAGTVRQGAKHQAGDSRRAHAAAAKGAVGSMLWGLREAVQGACSTER